MFHAAIDSGEFGTIFAAGEDTSLSKTTKDEESGEETTVYYNTWVTVTGEDVKIDAIYGAAANSGTVKDVNIQITNGEIGSIKMSISSNRHNETIFPKGESDGESKIYRQDVGIHEYVAINDHSRGSIVTESDINFNVAHSFANSAQPYKFDFYSVCLHEMGHTVGLADLPDGYPNGDYDFAVMWHDAKRNREKRTLKQDDKNGVAALY